MWPFKKKEPAIQVPLEVEEEETPDVIEVVRWVELSGPEFKDDADFNGIFVEIKFNDTTWFGFWAKDHGYYQWLTVDGKTPDGDCSDQLTNIARCHRRILMLNKHCK